MSGSSATSRSSCSPSTLPTTRRSCRASAARRSRRHGSRTRTSSRCSTSVSTSAQHQHFIVMEHVSGNSCAELLRDRGHLEVDEAVDVLSQACRGLDYAHRNGVVHRDVKPGQPDRIPTATWSSGRLRSRRATDQARPTEPSTGQKKYGSGGLLERVCRVLGCSFVMADRHRCWMMDRGRVFWRVPRISR